MAHCSDADAALLEVSVTLTEELEDCLNSVTNCADKGVQRSGLGPMMRGLGNGIAPMMRCLVTVPGLPKEKTRKKKKDFQQKLVRKKQKKVPTKVRS